ncbi:LAMI_0C05182g1_1 [Lachancea mirantina]|uniref:LAMI_0C05182g1_1 n=1 Tax=Lachancea mirantina TaxID=1230905 RepID=A0A1G4J2P4_9SACH|nr:LAMI_0C05182g1_1 [Lachancea mirantina]
MIFKKTDRMNNDSVDNQPTRYPSSVKRFDHEHLNEARSLMGDHSTVLIHCIQILLLEYINEPRFRNTAPEPRLERQRSPGVSEALSKSGRKINKRTSWFGGDETMSAGAESRLMKRLSPALGTYLRKVVMHEVRPASSNLRRSLLKLYNDLYLDSSGRSSNSDIQSIEELILRFSRVVSGELSKLGISDGQEEVFKQVSYFIDLLSKLAAESKASSSKLDARLREYKVAFKSSSAVPYRTSSPGSQRPNLIKPDFNISKITHATYLQKLLGIAEDKFQRTIDDLAASVSNEALLAEITLYKQRLISSDPHFARLFTSQSSFSSWQASELEDLDQLIAKLKSSKGQTFESHHQTTKYPIIPAKSRSLFVYLAHLIFKQEIRESKEALVDFTVSNDGLFFLTKCALYWRVNLQSSKASLVYCAANLEVLQGETLDPTLYGVFYRTVITRVLKTDQDCNTLLWTELDQRTWASNLEITFHQCINSLLELISRLHEIPRPKFSPVLQVFHGSLLADPMFSQVGDLNLAMKLLRKALFKATESFYVSLLDSVPRNKNIDISHVSDVAYRILQEVKEIQKRYSRPLLDEINLAHEVAIFLIAAFGADCSTMLTCADHYSNAGEMKAFKALDALETYKQLAELRDVYKQVQPSKKFPFKLERFFVKYLSAICDDTCDRIMAVVQNSIENEEWRPISAERNYSASVIDVFKMISESIDVFEGFKWNNSYQIAKIFTFLFKSIADALALYSSRVLQNLRQEVNELQALSDKENVDDQKQQSSIAFFSASAANKMKTTWIFNEMKSALKSSEMVLPLPFVYSRKVCTCLSDADEMTKLVSKLEDKIDLQKISKIVNETEQAGSKSKRILAGLSRGLCHLYTVNVVGAKGLRPSSSGKPLNCAVSFVDMNKKKEIAKTRIVTSSTHPTWNEEFELALPHGESKLISVTLWGYRSNEDLSSSKTLGRCFLSLDSNNSKGDGLPEELCLTFDTHGDLKLAISMETEQLDALFCMGRAYRTLERASEHSVHLVVNQFTTFIDFAFSHSTLKTICGNAGNVKPDKAIVYDAIVPLFDYLNSNLAILAVNLSRDLLFKIMLEAWQLVLKAADDLLLPSLLDTQALWEIKRQEKSIWFNALDAAKTSYKTSTGFGRALTQIEIDTVFEWLRILCVEFFHNNGEGPSLSKLKSHHYQRLLIIPIFYDKLDQELIEEVKRLDPEYEKYLRLASDIEPDKRSIRVKSTRANTVARRKTFHANWSKQKRKQLDDEITKADNDPLEIMAATQDILLRICLAKGNYEFVTDTLKAREASQKRLLAEKFVQTFSSGRH